MHIMAYCMSIILFMSGMFFAKSDNIPMLFVSALFMIAAAIAYRKEG